MAGTGGVERAYVPLASGPAAVNVAVQVKVPQRGGARIQIGFLTASYSGAPAGGRLTVSDGDVPELDLDITAAGPQLIPVPEGGLTFQPGQAVTASLTAGGAAVVGKISLGYRYLYDR